MGIEASGLDNLITASYDLLGLISFLTDGKKECRAWTIRKGTKAPQAAGKIHSDFERGFIRASVIGYSDLEANNFDYAAVKAKGLQRTEGKEYVVKDGDVIEFLFNVWVVVGVGAGAGLPCLGFRLGGGGGGCFSSGGGFAPARPEAGRVFRLPPPYLWTPLSRNELRAARP